MNNYQWLLQMDGADRKAWFDAEHVETEEQALDGDTAALNASKFQDERDVLQAEVDRLTAERDNLADDLLTANRQREQYRKLFGMALDWAHEITMLESSVDEGMA